jgi:phosphoglycerate dehydrogenase-like enzyme
MNLAIPEDCAEFRMVRIACGDDAPIPWLRSFLAPEPIDADGMIAKLHELGAGWRAPPIEGSPELADALRDADAFVVERARVDDETLAAASPRLRRIVKYGTDPRNIDLEACHRCGVEVVSIARETTSQVADHALMLLLVLARRFAGPARLLPGMPTVEIHAPSTEEGGHPPTVFNWLGVEGIRALRSQRLAVLGAGEIGRAVMRRALGFEMDVRYWDVAPIPLLDEKLGVSWIALDKAASWADAVTLHLPYAPELTNLVDGAFLERLGPSGLLVNTSRGLLVDLDALIGALNTGTIAGAALDVYPEEPPPRAEELTAVPNLVLTPHVGAGSRWAVFRDVRAVIEALPRGEIEL